MINSAFLKEYLDSRVESVFEWRLKKKRARREVRGLFKKSK